MEVGRLALAMAFFGIAGAALYLFGDAPEDLSISDVKLHPMGSGLALEAKIKNEGAPDRLVGLGSDAAMQSNLRGGSTPTFAIPAGSTPSLSMDGVHGMLTGVQGDVSEGRLVPVSLWFERSGRVAARARVVTNNNMNHADVVEANDPLPGVAMTVEANDNGWIIRLETTNFTFSQQSVDEPHQNGVGHGHLYLNGLKLQRIFEKEVKIGELPPGAYEFFISLNSNDHRAYVKDGRFIGAAASIVVD